MTHLGLGVAVFVTDALITYMGWQSLDSWLTGRRMRTLAWNVGADIAIAINTMGFIEAKWWMLVPSILGSMVGTLASFSKGTEHD